MASHELSSSQQKHLQELTCWVHQKFGRYSKFYQYKEAFNAHFHGYQADIQLKLDLESISSGLVSCAVAALITGIWWELQNEHKAEFFMTKVPGKSDNLHKRHVYLALPAIKILSNIHFMSVIKDTNFTKSPLVADYLIVDETSAERKFVLVETPQNRIPENIRRTSGVKRFAKERYSLFNYHPEYPYPPAESSSSLSTHSLPTDQPQK